MSSWMNTARHALDSHGRSVTIRPAPAGDRELLSQLSNALSPRSVYLRFFSSSRSAAEHYLCALGERSQDAGVTLLAFQGADLVGVAAFEPIAATQAELSVLVSDSHHHCGIGTLLIESLVDQARDRGFTHFVAEVLAENGPMMTVLRDLGLHFESSIRWGVDTVSIDLERIEEFTAARASRERASTAASLELGTADLS
jgi:GNAT superfamily N-acetyltransferase